MASVTSASKVSLFYYDCEVDGIDKDTANITEVCVRNEKKEGEYFVAYVSKPEGANYDGPFQKPIPAGKSRRSFRTVVGKMSNFIVQSVGLDGTAILMGYNVTGWDEPVLAANCLRFGAPRPLTTRRFFDISIVAQKLGFPRGTTQQQLEFALQLQRLPANRHRAHADVKVVKEIWARMVENIADNRSRMDAIKMAMLEERSEERVAELLKEYDPSLIPSEETLKIIELVKAAEKAPRRAIVVLYDTETTGLFQEMNRAAARHHNRAPRIIEFAAKIVSGHGETFQSFVNPGERVTIPPEATAVHGITKQDLKGAPSMAVVWKQFETWIKTSKTFEAVLGRNAEMGTEPRVIFVGYNNLRFDDELLKLELLPGGVDMKRRKAVGEIQSWDAMMLMSTWYTGAKRKPPSNKLQDHAQFLGIPLNNAHRALSDVETLEAVLRTISAPLDLAEFLSHAASMERPGVGAKEVIREAQALINEGIEADRALEEALRAYKQRVEESKADSVEAAPSKRPRTEASLPINTQDFVVGTQADGSLMTYI